MWGFLWNDIYICSTALARTCQYFVILFDGLEINLHVLSTAYWQLKVGNMIKYKHGKAKITAATASSS